MGISHGCRGKLGGRESESWEWREKKENHPDEKDTRSLCSYRKLGRVLGSLQDSAPGLREGDWPWVSLFFLMSIFFMASLLAQLVKNPPEMWETGFDPWVRKIPWRRDRLPIPVFLGREDPLEGDMATHSSILAWRTPWTEEPGGLQPVGSELDTPEAA